ncbi:transmembrane protein, putative (macronuclear) [Tetrahymena thermophila SB210]|uniref:Transmembrane protein, putative n=1 Tax=Tetrahymena thermophila (strain SB210) TaxID=312017 RepID=Q23T94_TETTS|nr:transmembrane protein, putative [Tetrahymena thermophila SB210]EAR99812.2 transmembrane protein, putative [Tetrahymena thermophila SB210]|eukprot:XP_001020057.2 transmembrane protein, putative [Tetrahymena thermophila SB210]
MNQNTSEVFVYLKKRKGDESYSSNDLMNISANLEPNIQNNFVQPCSDGTIQILDHSYQNSIEVQLQQSIYPNENNIKHDCIIESDEQDRQRVNTIILSVPIPKTAAFEQVEVDLAEQDKNQKVNIDECFLKLKKMHIQYKTEEDQKLDYNFCKSNCNTKVGCSGCFYSSQEKSSLNNLGIAINIYFRQLKGLVWLTLLFMLISIPTIVFYSMAASKGDMSTINNYSSFLAYTFAGAWGYDVWECKMGTFESLNKFDSGKLQCDTGVFDTTFMRFGIIDQSNSENFLGCEFAQVENIDENCLSSPEKYFTELCNNKTQCQIDFSEMIQKSFKQDAKCKQFFLQNQIYLSFPCANSSVDFGSFKIQKSDLSIYCVIADNIIFFIFLIAVFSLTYSDQLTINQITMNNCMPEHFSILIRNLPDIEQKFLASKLWEHLQNYLDQYCQTNNKQPIKIIDIKLGYRYRQIKCQVQQGKIQGKLERLIQFFLQEYGKQNQKLKDLINVTINHLRAIYELIQDIDMKEKANLDLQKIINLKQELFSLRTKDFEFNQKKNKIDYAWVTFETMEQKQQAWNILQTSKIKYIYYTIIYKFQERFQKEKKSDNDQIKQLHFMRKVLVLETPYSPDSIIWQNLYYSKINIFFRMLFLIIASIAIVVISFIGIAILRSLDRLLTDDYPQANCYSSFFSNLTLKYIQNLPDTIPDYQKKAYIQCFCWKSNYQFNQDTNLKSVCRDWFINYIEKLSIPVGIVFVVFFVNWIFKKIYTSFTNLEKQVYQNKRKNSIILKLFTISFINSVLVVYFINRSQQNVDQDQSQFMVQVFANGQYYDLNSEWYRNVGVIYAITIITKCFFVPLEKLFYYAYKKFEIWRDQGYTANIRATKCKSNQEFIKLRRGPKFNLEIRYAQSLEVLYLMMVFGSGIPLMYFITFLYFLFTLMADRYLIFSVCRIPKPSDEQMSQLFQKILYFSFFLHWVVSSFTFGSPLLFYDIQDKKSLDKSTSEQEPFIYNIVDNRYLIPQYFGIVIIILTYILSFCINPFTIITAFTRKKTPASEKNSRIKNNSFYEFLSKEQIITELDIADYTIYVNSKDTYLVQKMIQRLEQLELQLAQRDNQEPKMTFLGSYSYDYKLSKKFKDKLRWYQDLKIWRLEQSKALNKQSNAQTNQRENSSDQKLGSHILSNQILALKQKQILFESSKIVEKQQKYFQEIKDYNKNLKSQHSILKQNIKDQKKQSPPTSIYADKNNTKDIIFFLNNRSVAKNAGQSNQIFENINSNKNINLNSNQNININSNQNINLNRDSNELYFFQPKYIKSIYNHNEKQNQSVVQSEQELNSKSKPSIFDLAILGKKQQSIYNIKQNQLNITPNQDGIQEDNSNLEINDDLEHKRKENNMQFSQQENDSTSVDEITLHQKPYSFLIKL